MMSPALRTTAALLLLGLSACGSKTSHQDLEAKIAELEDENDLLKQQLADARLQAEEAMVAAERAKAPAPAFTPPMLSSAPEVPPDLFVDGGHDDPEAFNPPPRRSSGSGDSASARASAGSAAAAAAEAAETARKALAN